MHTLRYNPAYNRWVLLGGVPSEKVHIHTAHLLENQGKEPFLAAVHPHNPFVTAPDDVPPTPKDGLVFVELPPVGEYELLLYRGKKAFRDWVVSDWEAWLKLLQHRLVMMHHNPYLHHFHVTLESRLLDTIENYTRVGDVIGSSHLLSVSSEMSPSTVEKLYAREAVFRVAESTYEFVQVPSAPLHSHELWVLPKNPHSGIEGVHGDARKSLAATIHAIMPVYGTHPVTMRIHTCVAGSGHTWWIQFYTGQKGSDMAMEPRPEGFAARLHIARR